MLGSMLSSREIEEVHGSALQVLQEVGVLFESSGALQILKANGAEVRGSVAYIPEELVKDCLKKAPSSISLYDLDGRLSCRLEDDNVYFNPGSTASWYIDENGVRRRPFYGDMVRFSQVVEKLSFIHMQSTALVVQDVEEDLRAVSRLQAVLECSKKPVVTGVFKEDDFGRMMSLLSRFTDPSRPVAIFDACPNSPLRWSRHLSHSVVECARNNIPSTIISMPIPFVCSPPTLAGSLVQHHAENLSGIVLAECAAPGAKVIYGGSPSLLGKTPLMSHPGVLKLILAYNRIGKHFGIPTHAYLGVSDSLMVDERAFVESAYCLTMGREAGVNVISGPGMLEGEKTQSILKLVIDNIICENSFTRGSSFVNMVLETAESTDAYSYRSTLEKEVEVNEDTLCLRLIKEVGPGGSYLKPKYMREYHRVFSREFSMPSIRDFQHELLKELFEEARREAASFLAGALKNF
ncbi:MAG: trimethylamine methyltransferase family protein [Crenarchaeota archaeon]|nr:trimethylamine methyltransferase family protein [Thermoproteota archaeon]